MQVEMTVRVLETFQRSIGLKELRKHETVEDNQDTNEDHGDSVKVG